MQPLKEKLKSYQFKFDELVFRVNPSAKAEGLMRLDGEVKVGSIQIAADKKAVKMQVRQELNSPLITATAQCSLIVHFEKSLESVSPVEIARLGTELAQPYLETLISDTAVKFKLPPLRQDENRLMADLHASAPSKG